MDGGNTRTVTVRSRGMLQAAASFKESGPRDFRMGEDVLRVLEAHKVHWAFYAFGEDAWDGMDYELGDAALPWTYWHDVEASRLPTPKRTDSPQFAPILKRLRAAGH